MKLLSFGLFWCGAFVLGIHSIIFVRGVDQHNIVPDVIEKIYVASPWLCFTLCWVLMLLFLKFDFSSFSFNERIQDHVIDDINLAPTDGFSKFLLTMVVIFTALSFINIPKSLSLLIVSGIFLFFYLFHLFEHRLLNYIANNANPKAIFWDCIICRRLLHN